MEKWISDKPFEGATSPGSSDLDICRSSRATEQKRQTLEHHWDTWIVESDFEWLSQRGINTVRIPVRFFCVCFLLPLFSKAVKVSTPPDLVLPSCWLGSKRDRTHRVRFHQRDLRRRLVQNPASNRMGQQVQHRRSSGLVDSCSYVLRLLHFSKPIQTHTRSPRRAW